MDSQKRCIHVKTCAWIMFFHQSEVQRSSYNNNMVKECKSFSLWRENKKNGVTVMKIDHERGMDGYEVICFEWKVHH